MDLRMSEIARDDLAACRALLTGGSRTFRAASFLLPRRVADPATALYAFCRVADDEVDEAGGGAEAVAALERRLDAICAGHPAPFAADRAFASVVARFGIPRALPAALIEGLAWDAAGRRYATLADLESYAARVAGAVGAMMTLLMGVRAPDAIARAADLGTAMQLTNIARDVGEDARNGRVYLPLDWLAEAGLSPEALIAAPCFTPALGAVVARLLEVADMHYARAEEGIGLLPLDCRAGIAAARLVYAEIGRSVERQGCDSVAARAVVPGSRKAALLARATWLGWRATVPAGAAPALPANAFLVESVATSSVSGAAIPLPWWAFGQRVLRVAELFARLGERDRRGMAQAVRS